MQQKIHFVFQTTQQTLDAEKVLRARGIDYLTTTLPKSIAAGCTIALILNEESSEIALSELMEAGQSPECVFDENWQRKKECASAPVQEEIYLDFNSTTPVDPQVAEEMLTCLSRDFGNPSSIYSIGRTAKKAIEQARTRVAALIHAKPEEILFTSGGTEANTTALIGTAYALEEKGRHIITSQIEHKSVLSCSKFLEQRGFEITHLPVSRYGIVDLDELDKAVRPDTILISIMYANNEIGTIQPIEEIAGIARKHKTRFHTDAVQAAGKIEIDVEKFDCDLMSLSSHKIYGPKGAGALFIRNGTDLCPIIFGGKQERGLRGGTENIPGIVGFGKAAQMAVDKLGEIGRLKTLRDKLYEGLLQEIPEIILNGHPEKRIPNTLNISIPGIEAEALVINLDLKGIFISAGSACTSGTVEPSHVLTALGVGDELAKASIRLSLGRYNTENDIQTVVTAISSIVARLRALKSST